MPFVIVGPLAPELLLDAQPAGMTNDADVIVVDRMLAEFDALKDRLARWFGADTPRAALAPCER